MRVHASPENMILPKWLQQEAIGGKSLIGTPAAALRLNLEVWLLLRHLCTIFLQRS